ncbi:hypothetical protein [Hyphomonas johnsonii]|jgi:hypothetical protein|uniref:Uncharacterized protein n=1 Tax=Hyphomonas johnsonii MHS-2 TaxID=1280950 RepID=A0A059FHM1_9PROT|nr:hypothetical protein [Hyphomonas johnsonii]KCZ90016.1 hypothetical protein HJO_13741 [Hyphomonas johnsonii MHS-2]
MAGKTMKQGGAAVSSLQLQLEIENGRKTINRLAAIIRMVGDTGVSDADTAAELDAHLGAAYAAASRWLLESRIEARRLSARRFV